MTKRQRDFTLLDEVIAKIQEEPERWKQDDWATGLGQELPDGSHEINCGTSFCIAGWAATIAGGKWADSARLLAEPEDYPDGLWHGSGRVWADHRAQRLLGLTEFETTQLFDGDNTLEDVLKIVQKIKDDTLDDDWEDDEDA